MHEKTGSRFAARELVIPALFAALTGVLSQLAIPLHPVPFSFGYLAVMLCISVLPMKQALGAVTAFLSLGAVGVPVFTGFQGGVQRLMGPTGGFLMGYLLFALTSCALIGPGLREGVVYRFLARLTKRGLLSPLAPLCGFLSLSFALLCGMLVDCVCGALWLSVYMRYSVWQAFVIGVFPFLAFDLVKLVMAALLAPRLLDALRRGGLKP